MRETLTILARYSRSIGSGDALHCVGWTGWGIDRYCVILVFASRCDGDSIRNEAGGHSFVGTSGCVKTGWCSYPVVARTPANVGKNSVKLRDKRQDIRINLSITPFQPPPNGLHSHHHDLDQRLQFHHSRSKPPDDQSVD